MILSLNEILKLKNELLEEHSIILHIHDTCGGQYFSINEQDLKNIDKIKNFFNNKNYNLSFSDDNLRFRIK